MTPNRRTTRMPRLLTAAAGTALTLSLSGCGLLGGGDEPAEGPESEAAQPSEGASDAGTDSSDEGSMTQTTPSESTTADPAEAEPTDTASTDLFADAARTTNWASDDAMDVDDEGNGIVPARSIEADLIDLFENKLEMKVEKAECANDMELSEWYGFETCDVTVEDDERTTGEKTYYGTVKIVDHKDSMIKYELMFPGIDQEDFDFKD